MHDLREARFLMGRHEGCSNCGHGYDARCSRCYRSFACGLMAVRCEECGEGIVGHVVDAGHAAWLTEFYGDYPEQKEDSNLEDPRENTTYQLKSEASEDVTS